jgi:hypothetical protein
LIKKKIVDVTDCQKTSAKTRESIIGVAFMQYFGTGNENRQNTVSALWIIPKNSKTNH